MNIDQYVDCCIISIQPTLVLATRKKPPTFKIIKHTAYTDIIHENGTPLVGWSINRRAQIQNLIKQFWKTL